MSKSEIISMHRLIKYIHTNYFTNKTLNDKQIEQNINNKKYHNWDDILRSLYQYSMIKYFYIKDISNIILIQYTELNSEPLFNTIRYHPANYGYGDFEKQIVLLYEYIIKRTIIINLLLMINSWSFPRDISIYICRFYWELLK